MTRSGRSRKYQERAPVEATGLPGRYLVAGCLRQTARDSGLEAAWTMCVVVVCIRTAHAPWTLSTLAYTAIELGERLCGCSLDRASAEARRTRGAVRRDPAGCDNVIHGKRVTVKM